MAACAGKGASVERQILTMKIVVLCGGVSTEREISIVSGTEVCKALRSKGHAAILLDVFFGEEHPNLMDAFPEDYDVDEAAERIRLLTPEIKGALANRNRTFFGANVITLCKMSDIVFLALHGEDGENGKVQAAFDLRRIRYTGSGSLGSALAMDKSVSKIMLASAGIPTPPGFILKKADLGNADLRKRGISYPVVVKVCCGGSSVGVYMVTDDDEYRDALENAFRLEDEVIVEKYIRGREFSVGVINGEALPIIEIQPLKGFYDYANKYTKGAAIETCPADISGEHTRRMKQYAEAGYRCLRLESYGRLDFMMDENGDIYCLEANSLPGMTPTSLMPQEAASLGVNYASLCEKLIEVSLEKYKKQA